MMMMMMMCIYSAVVSCFLTLVLEMAVVTACYSERMNEEKCSLQKSSKISQLVIIIIKCSLYICLGGICRQFLESTIMLYLAPMIV